MVFKVKKDPQKTNIRMVSFRLPEALLKELEKIAKAENISMTELVKQMLEHCVDDYKK